MGGLAYDGGGMGGVENTAGIAPTLAGWYVDNPFFNMNPINMNPF